MDKYEDWKNAVYFMWTTRTGISLALLVAIFAVWENLSYTLKVINLITIITSIAFCYLAITSIANYRKFKAQGAEAFFGKRSIRGLSKILTKEGLNYKLESMLRANHTFAEFSSGLFFMLSIILFTINIVISL